jgi:fimbrial chaperone protein
MVFKILNVCVFFTFFVTNVQAGAFQIDPVRVELAPGQLSAALMLRNDDNDTSIIRIEARAWSQKNGEDVFEATKEILVTPPIATIDAGAEQVVRVALRRPLNPEQELTYRIFLQEVPSPPRPGFNGLQVALRISIPVFAIPGSSAIPKPAWKITYQAKEHALLIGATNEGNAHLQVQDFKILKPGIDTVLATQSISSYLLGGQRREWTIKLDPSVRISGTKLRLTAMTDAGSLDQELEINAP